MAIIAVLAGMIMSALGRAKNSPRKAQCLNNLIWLRVAGTRADFSPAIQAQWNPRYGWPETRRTQPEMNLRTCRSQEQKKQNEQNKKGKEKLCQMNNTKVVSKPVTSA